MQKVCLLFNNWHAGRETPHFGEVTSHASWIYYFCIYRTPTQNSGDFLTLALQTFPSFGGEVGGKSQKSSLGGGGRGYPPRVLTRAGGSKCRPPPSHCRRSR